MLPTTKINPHYLFNSFCFLFFKKGHPIDEPDISRTAPIWYLFHSLRNFWTSRRLCGCRRRSGRFPWLFSSMSSGIKLALRGLPLCNVLHILYFITIFCQSYQYVFFKIWYKPLFAWIQTKFMCTHVISYQMLLILCV